MKDLLQSCLNSINKFTSSVKLEIIVIDNNSLDETSEMIQNEFPDIFLLRTMKIVVLLLQEIKV